MDKNDLRSKFLKPSVREIVEAEVDGVTVGLLKPTVKEREEIVKAGGSAGDSAFIASAIVKLAVVLDTGERMFTDEDVSTLIGQNVGETIDAFMPHIVKLLVKEEADVKKD